MPALTERKLLVVTHHGSFGIFDGHRVALSKLPWLEVVVELTQDLDSLSDLLDQHKPDWVLMCRFSRFGYRHLKMLIDAGVRCLFMPPSFSDRVDTNYLRENSIDTRVVGHNTHIERLFTECHQVHPARV
jgi:hypothetical protein